MADGDTTDIHSQTDRFGETKLEKFAWWLDESIELPGGYRVGAEAIIGLIPGIGDAVGLVFSLYIVFMAAREGVSATALLRMLVNVAIDTLIGVVPLLGDIFDGVFKANTRNVAILRAFKARRET